MTAIFVFIPYSKIITKDRRAKLTYLFVVVLSGVKIYDEQRFALLIKISLLNFFGITDR